MTVETACCSSAPTNPVSHRLARFAFLLACVSGLTVGISGPLHRYFGLDADMAIGVFRYGFYLAAAAIALGLATIVPTRPGDRRRGFVAALLALVVGAAAAWAPIDWLMRARVAPPISDITTDTANPPSLVVTLQFRQNASNPPIYGGESVASLQRAGYPDIQPIVLKVPPAEAFRKVDEVGDGDGLGRRGARAGRRPHRGGRHNQVVRLPRRHRGAHQGRWRRQPHRHPLQEPRRPSPTLASTPDASANSRNA